MKYGIKTNGGTEKIDMCDCRDNAELIIVHGRTKTYRCTKCGKEWEEKDVYDSQKE